MEVSMTKNPMEDYFEAKTKRASSRDEKHVELWQAWKADPNPQNLEPLLQQFKPIFNSKVKQWRAPNVNESAFRAELDKHAIKAFETYDPSRGTTIATHVTNVIQKAKRFNTQAQNLAYIPEDKARYIGKIDTARDQLREELGRDPTHSEIGGVVGISGRRVKEIQGLRRADIRGTAFQSDPLGHSASRDREIISLLRPELKGEEQVVYDYLYGQNGKPKVESTGEIARRLGKSASHVSRIKNRIAAVYKQYSQ
jgi:sigma-70-like protein